MIKRSLLIATVSLSVLSCGKDDPAPASAVQQASTGSSTIAGQVTPGPGSCATGPFNVTVYSGQSLVQQTRVDAGARFTFSVNPGNYTVSASDQTGCATQQAITTTQGQTSQVNLTIVQGGVATPGAQQPGYPQYPNQPYPSPSAYPGTGYGYGYGGGYGYGYGGGYGYGSGYGYQPGTTPYSYPYTYPYQAPPAWAPAVTYPYVWMYGPTGYGYYYYNAGSYAGPCTYSTGWLCANVF